MKLKKVICGLLAAVMMSAVMCPLTAFAAEKDAPATEAEPIVTSTAITREEFEQLEYVEGENNFEQNPMLRASGLINERKLDMARSSSNIIIVYATTGCIPEVSKCGFTEIIVQRRISSNQAWSNYITLEDKYTNSCHFETTYNMGITPGYQYRVTGVHYAYRNLFSTQKIDNSTPYMQF